MLSCGRALCADAGLRLAESMVSADQARDDKEDQKLRFSFEVTEATLHALLHF